MANPIVGSYGSPQSIFTTGTVKNHKTGTRGHFPDGRVFYYCENTTAAALTVGELLVTALGVVNHQNTTANASTDMGLASFKPIVTVGATAVTVNQYDEGWLSIQTDAGAGRTYKILHTPAVASGATGVFTLYDPIQVASDGTTAMTLTRNMWRDPQQSNTTVAENLVGIPQVTIAAGDTTTQYGWVQTWGPATGLADEAVTALAGQAIVAGTGVAGRVEEDDTATTVSQEQIVGYNLQPLIDGDHSLIFLTIAP